MENILLTARRNHFAVGAFNVNTYDEIVALVEASEKANLPVILMASMSCAKFFDPIRFVKICRMLDETYSIPVRSHLDHCTRPEFVKECANAGFDSVMYDGCQTPLEDNIRVTSALAEYCHARGVFIEGEIGIIYGEEGPVKSTYSEFSDPVTAKLFVEQTGIDALAISIGNAHGFYKGKPELHFDLLEKIADVCPLPLVLHGGTGIPDADLQKAVKLGICKINIGTEIRAAYMNALNRYPESGEKQDVREFVKYLRAAVGASAEKYIRNFRG